MKLICFIGHKRYELIDESSLKNAKDFAINMNKAMIYQSIIDNRCSFKQFNDDKIHIINKNIYQVVYNPNVLRSQNLGIRHNFKNGYVKVGKLFDLFFKDNSFIFYE